MMVHVVRAKVDNSHLVRGMVDDSSCGERKGG